MKNRFGTKLIMGKMKKRWLFIFAAVTAVLAAITILLPSSSVLYVEGIAVSEDEVDFFMSREKSAAYAHFADQYHADTSDRNFCETKFGGVTPNEYARERAVGAVVDSKNILLLAEGEGLDGSLTYSEIQKDWEDFVASRKKSVEDSGIVYGPVEMTFSDYYSYYISNVKLELFERYKADNPVQDWELETYYEEHRDLFAQGDTIKLKVYSMAGGQDAYLEELLKQARNEIESFGKVRAETKSSWEMYDEVELAIGEMSNKGDSRSNGIYLAAADGLSQGEVSEIKYDESIGYYMVQYLERKEGQPIPYEEVKNRLRDMIMTERFNDYLAERKEGRSVTIVDHIYENVKLN